jgi:hypothetical protein
MNSKLREVGVKWVRNRFFAFSVRGVFGNFMAHILSVQITIILSAALMNYVGETKCITESIPRK